MKSPSKKWAKVDVGPDKPILYDGARFYPIEGHRYPSVTTILDIIHKPALGPWYAKEERRVFCDAMLEVLTRPKVPDNNEILDAVIAAVDGLKAGDKAKTKAANIGTSAHAMIEWLTRTMLGEDPGVEPEIPEASQWAVESWKDWAKQVDLVPIYAERTVYSKIHGYAGTLDLYAKVKGELTVVDYKTGKAIYPEAFLQNVAYRHAGRERGMESAQGIILRLPKILSDPAFEAQPVPGWDGDIDDFLAVKRAWEWKRRMDGKDIGG